MGVVFTEYSIILQVSCWFVDDIVNQTGNSNVVVQHLDTSSLQSVREFAKELIKREKRLDILINNAGCAGIGEKKLTEDGLEYQMATNYFGHFLLTNLLLGNYSDEIYQLQNWFNHLILLG